MLQPVHGLAGFHQSLHSSFGVGALEGPVSAPLPGHCGVEVSSATTSGDLLFQLWSDLGIVVNWEK